ncbi:sulfite exporter TauE/SafE family protein [Clostridiaceae bacterium 35-E11]
MKYILFVVLAGMAAGFLNTVAGGGSLITMPILIFLGLPSAVANGTNRVALMVQNVIAIMNFRQKGFFDWKLSIMLAMPAVLGSMIGSKIAVAIPDYIFNKLLGIVMIMVLILTIWNPQKKLESKEMILDRKKKIIACIVFFFVGVYGGLIQAGVGFIIIISLTFITGFTLVKINSLKVFIVAVYMVSSLCVFVFSGKVNWIYGLSLAMGNGIGAYLGSNFSVNKGDKWIRIILVSAVSLMAMKLLGIFNL